MKGWDTIEGRGAMERSAISPSVLHLFPYPLARLSEIIAPLEA